MKKAIVLSPEVILGQQYRGFKVKPIGKPYFSVCPFKLGLDFTPSEEKITRIRDNIIEEMNSEQGLSKEFCTVSKSFERVLTDEFVKSKVLTFKNYAAEKFNGVVKTRSSGNTLHIFLENRKDFDHFITKYQDNIFEVYGVTSQGHLELLADPKFFVEEKEKPYYGKHFFRVTIMHENMDANDNSFRLWNLSSEARKELRNSLDYMRDFLSMQATKDEYKIRSESPAYFSIFCSEELAFDILPLAKFGMPSTRYSVTRVVCPNK